MSKTVRNVYRYDSIKLVSITWPGYAFVYIINLIGTLNYEHEPDSYAYRHEPGGFCCNCLGICSMKAAYLE